MGEYITKHKVDFEVVISIAYYSFLVGGLLLIRQAAQRDVDHAQTILETLRRSPGPGISAAQQ